MVLTMDLTLLLGYWSQARNNSLRSPLLTFTFTRSEKNYKTVKDFLTSSASSSPVRERASLGISAVKSLVLRGKEEKVAAEFIDDEAWALIQSILDVEGLTIGRKVGIFVENLPGTMTLPRDIHGAPPHSLIVKISEVMGSFKTLRKMALFWCRLVAEIPEPERSSSDASNCIFILRGIINEADDVRSRYTTVDAVSLFVSKDFSCIDLSLYKLQPKFKLNLWKTKSNGVP